MFPTLDALRLTPYASTVPTKQFQRFRLLLTGSQRCKSTLEDTNMEDVDRSYVLTAIKIFTATTTNAIPRICNYGRSCNRLKRGQCLLTHSDLKKKGICTFSYEKPRRTEQELPVKYGNRDGNNLCECYHGNNCTKDGCKFQHPDRREHQYGYDNQAAATAATAGPRNV
jgi:hypothetical protein